MKQTNVCITASLVVILLSCSASKQVAKTTTQPKVNKEITEIKITETKKPIENPVQNVEISKAAVDSIKKEIPKTIIKVKEVETKLPQDTEDTTPVPVKKSKVPEQPIKAIPVFSHTTWNDLIRKNVAANGDVNYKGFKGNWSVLRRYISQLAQQLPEDSWSTEEKLAYWMNAYNALTVDLILRNYPTKSIKDIKDPWDQRLWKLGKKWYNLNEIEHQILRKLNDPRIHFGINCASFSCPPLLNEAFTAEKVNAQLDFLAKRFINDGQRNNITANTIKISKIFSWFSKDFKKDGDLISFLNKYAEVQISNKAKKSYVDYNWALNEQ